MTRRQEVEHQRLSLAEVRDIMNSMKTLAYMETRKLERYVNAENAVLDSIEDVAKDFISFHADTLPATTGSTREAQATPVYVVIGTERGFCGDFNQALIRQLDETLAGTDKGTGSQGSNIILVGHKLINTLDTEKLNDGMLNTTKLVGASVVDEVLTVLEQIVQKLSSLQQQHGMLAVHAIYHDGQEGTAITQLLPPFQHLREIRPQHADAPVLNIDPAEFLVELTEHYLLAALLSILYVSLDAENRHRVSHLEGAIKHMDEESEELARKSNTLRQEEIIEEIEVILLSAGNIEEDIKR
jgi:F-type H+-transporting ATPase subunit gamma